LVISFKNCYQPGTLLGAKETGRISNTLSLQRIHNIVGDREFEIHIFSSTIRKNKE
jgi:hypothetical protein